MSNNELNEPKDDNIENNDSGIQIYDTFQDMDLKPSLERGISGMGFEKPSEIQKQAIMPIITKGDVIVQAQSGTGKTATFAIATLQKIDEKLAGPPQALIISPTRELAAQTHDVIERLGSLMGARVALFIGGVPTACDLEVLRNKLPHIIVATPGRLLDLLQTGQLVGSSLSLLVIDEADEILSHGFEQQISDIFARLPKGMQIVLVSATIPEPVLRITDDIMTNPTKILVTVETLTLEGIKQYKIIAKNDADKTEIALDIFKSFSMYQSVIFCNMKKKAIELYEKFVEHNFQPLLIHGDLEQGQRNDVMVKFRTGEGRILITTDLTARGIDVQQVSIVINYDMPKNTENYIHRIGRSGRFGRKGLAINLVLETEITFLNEIEKFYHTTINNFPAKNEVVNGQAMMEGKEREYNDM